MNELIKTLTAWALPMVSIGFALWLAIVIIRRILGNRAGNRAESQMLQLAAAVIALVVFILVAPIGDNTQGQLLSLLGIVVTGVIGWASTSFVSNAMAGLMLRSVSSFGGGDFIRVGDFFGRVTETALFHTEIQNQDRDLVTMPNLYLITHPVEVVRSSGTLIAADISLGYDLHRRRIRELLVRAAEDAELTDAFVQITELGDYSVTYRVSGFLQDVSNLLSKQTALRANMLDRLHEDGIEIVSPSFMNQRALSPDDLMVPKDGRHGEDEDHNGRPEQMMFDKAEVAGRLKQLGEQRARLGEEVAELKKSAGGQEADIRWRVRQIESIDEILASLDTTPKT